MKKIFLYDGLLVGLTLLSFSSIAYLKGFHIDSNINSYSVLLMILLLSTLMVIEYIVTDTVRLGFIAGSAIIAFLLFPVSLKIIGAYRYVQAFGIAMIGFCLVLFLGVLGFTNLARHARENQVPTYQLAVLCSALILGLLIIMVLNLMT